MSLPEPLTTVEKLQNSLQTKAKAEPAFRFYALWDKVHRKDILLEAYQRCRANAGAPGVDCQTFDMIEAQGVERWLGALREELTLGTYAPQPLLRVWIPKSNGGQRPLGVPTIRDRVVQMAVVLVIGPIFEADLLPQQYGFCPGLDAKMAQTRVLARDATRTAGRGGRGFTRLLHVDPASSADALPVPADRRWTRAPHYQELVDGSSGGDHRWSTGADR
jgi:hypothetical protein